MFQNKILIDEDHRDLLHHVLMYECDPSAKFNDSNLPQGNCFQIQSRISLCRFTLSIGWAIGGDLVKNKFIFFNSYLIMHILFDQINGYPPEAGYPIGNNLPIKYYLIETHITNSQRRTG